MTREVRRFFGDLGLRVGIGVVAKRERQMVRDKEILERMVGCLPEAELRKLFTSPPSRTKGEAVYPYIRTDSYVSTLNNIRGKKETELYDQVYCKMALRLVLLVQIAYGGWDDLARDPREIERWRDAGGRKLNNKEQLEYLLTKGLEMYQEGMSAFVWFRHCHFELAKSDLFTQHGLEYLLDEWAVRLERQV